MVEILVQSGAEGQRKLPKEVMAELGLKNGDFVELTLKDGKCILEPVTATKGPGDSRQSDAS